MPIRVTIELIPHGYESRKRKLAILYVENMGRCTETHDRYVYKLESGLSNPDGTEPGNDYHNQWSEIIHPRGADRLGLICAVIKAAQEADHA